MLKRNRTEGLHASIEIEIITRLYAALPQILCISAGLVIGAAIMAARTGDQLLWSIFVAAIATSAIRVAGIIAFHRRQATALTLDQAHRWEDLYAWSAFAFTAVLATLTFRIFQAGYSDGHILAVGLSMALTAGSSARTLRFWICATLSTVALATLITCMLLTGDLLLQSMALLLALYLYSVFEASAHIVGQIEAVLVAERELDHAARRDVLTRTANRRAFDETLALNCANGMGFALLLLDLDGFKAVNDRHGHAAGDEVLRQVADRLSQTVRSTDMLARLGGDEFGIILPAADAAAAAGVAKRAVASLCVPFAVCGATAVIGTSIGIKVTGPGAQPDPNHVQTDADEALYAAKAAGKGQAIFAKAA